ncbi:hypothetical protein R3P38DRAFT_3581669 [Favolaschia claudopus]|uniref:Uncharacterized protein n=1 Tax=Favolaschia claudopus TaxID=2862362 RepID=A0AAW0AJY3_9AGAR
MSSGHASERLSHVERWVCFDTRETHVRFSSDRNTSPNPRPPRTPSHSPPLPAARRRSTTCPIVHMRSISTSHQAAFLHIARRLTVTPASSDPPYPPTAAAISASPRADLAVHDTIRPIMACSYTSAIPACPAGGEGVTGTRTNQLHHDLYLYPTLNASLAAIAQWYAPPTLIDISARRSLINKTKARTSDDGDEADAQDVFYAVEGGIIDDQQRRRWPHEVIAEECPRW